jgi:hypothetical protein
MVPISTPGLDSLVKLLSTFEGRDKLIRTSYYTLLLVAGRLNQGALVTKLANMARQLSAARTIGRRWNDPVMIKANLAHFQNGFPEKDRFNFIVNGLINIIYLFYHPVEHVAWLSGFELLPVDPNKWWTYTTWLWTIALILSITRTIRTYIQLAHSRYRVLAANNDRPTEESETLKRRQVDEMWTLLMYVSDFAVAIQYLPKGWLWSQTLPQWKVGAFGLMASLIGLVKLFQRM